MGTLLPTASTSRTRLNVSSVMGDYKNTMLNGRVSKENNVVLKIDPKNPLELFAPFMEDHILEDTPGDP